MGCHRVDALTLTQVLAQKKNADLNNKEVIIKAKMEKQTKIIQSEGLWRSQYPQTIRSHAAAGRLRAPPRRTAIYNHSSESHLRLLT